MATQKSAKAKLEEINKQIEQQTNLEVLYVDALKETINELGVREPWRTRILNSLNPSKRGRPRGAKSKKPRAGKASAE